MTKKPEHPDSSDELDLSPEFIRELKRRIAGADNPVRYAIFSDIGGQGRWRLWLDVTTDCYGMSLDQATLFKRERIARAVVRANSEGRKNDLRIAKITTKNGKRKVLQYLPPDKRTSQPARRGKPSR